MNFRGSSPEFIAEVSSNHNKDIHRALAFIEEAAACGCSGVKFQLFRVEKLFSQEILQKSPTHQERKSWELPLDFIPKLSAKAKETGMKFGCTPFYLDAVEELYDYVDFYKIASYELIWTELLEKVAQTEKPVILSTGMAFLEEIQEAVSTLISSGCQDLTLLHCVSAYPIKPDMCNLKAISTLRSSFPQCAVGWSDHSRSPAVIFRAVHRWDAKVIEFHMDLDSKGDEYSMGHCWLPDEIRPVIQQIKEGLIADGDGIKAPIAPELPDRAWRRDPLDGLRPLKETRKKFKP